MANPIVGNDGNNTLQGSTGMDVHLRYDPNGPCSGPGRPASLAYPCPGRGLADPRCSLRPPPGDTGRLFRCRRPRRLVLDLASGKILATPLLDVSRSQVTDGERGLLGLAFDPNFAERLLLRRSHQHQRRRRDPPLSGGRTRTADPASVTRSSPSTSRRQQPQGRLARLRSRRLSLQFARRRRRPGDRNAQDLDSLLGKMLRIDVSGDAFRPTRRNYAMPADNPFVGVAAARTKSRWACVTRGAELRPRLGDLYIADVGRTVGGDRHRPDGANYGWNVFEGPFVLAAPPPRILAVPPIYIIPSHRRADHRRLRLPRRRRSAARAVFLRGLRRARCSRCASTAALGSAPIEPRRSSRFRHGDQSHRRSAKTRDGQSLSDRFRRRGVQADADGGFRRPGRRPALASA